MLILNFNTNSINSPKPLKAKSQNELNRKNDLSIVTFLKKNDKRNNPKYNVTFIERFYLRVSKSFIISLKVSKSFIIYVKKKHTKNKQS